MKLFLDDERWPPADGESWMVVRTVSAAVEHMEALGCPTFISFDHDLGKGAPGGDAINLVHWMIERDMDSNGMFIPANFEYYVHSQNPTGAENIRGWLGGYLKQRG